jgi:formate hydrogenlyase subunit 6/NADH:ubiquinone oxidoreductase subunit I
VEEKAVHSGKGKKAKYDYKKCIRCYCCQEMCPVKAIEVYRHPLTKLLSGK